MGTIFSLTFFALSRSIKHGDPAALEDYRGGRDYDRFAPLSLSLSLSRSLSLALSLWLEDYRGGRDYDRFALSI